ncbi:MAG: hypothetical protein AMXMBFR66_03030 [Pseudomonadota bacterium]|jgi:mono/diheme cytochrome c family protein
MTRESRARWLAAATTALVVLLAALFALLHNRPAPPEPAPAVAPTPPPAAVSPPPPTAEPAAAPGAPGASGPATTPQTAPVLAVNDGAAVPAAGEPGSTATVSPKPAPAHAPDPARIAAGERAYARLGCAICHSIEGRGNPGSPLDGVGARLGRQALYELTTGTGAAGEQLGAGLARRKQRAVGDPELDALIDYLAQLR